MIHYLEEEEKQTVQLYRKQLLGVNNVFSTRSLLITRSLSYKVSVVQLSGWRPDDEMCWLANVKQKPTHTVAVVSPHKAKCSFFLTIQNLN